VTGGVFATQAAALAQLPFAGLVPTLAPFAMMFGAANGMSTLARASSVAEIYGPRHYGAISGAMALGANGARAVGPVAASLLVLALGSYERVFWLLTVALGAVAVGVFATDTEIQGEPSKVGTESCLAPSAEPRTSAPTP